MEIPQISGRMMKEGEFQEDPMILLKKKKKSLLLSRHETVIFHLVGQNVTVKYSYGYAES